MPGLPDEYVTRLCQYIMQEAPEAEVVFYGKEVVSSNELITLGQDAKVLVSWDQPMDDKTYEAMSLRAYCLASVGYDAANLPAATRQGVYVVNVPDYCTQEVATHTIALMLSLHRRLPRLTQHVLSGYWNSDPLSGVRRFENSTVGLLGFGRIGQAVARKLQGFGVTVLACDPAHDVAFMREQGVKKVEFTNLLQASDYLSLHTPLLESTKEILDREAFRLMKPGLQLINTARGGLIDEDALLAALNEGVVHSAALDVLAVEPPARNHPLLSHPSVIVTGHTAYFSIDSSDYQLRLTVKNVALFLQHEIPVHTLNALDVSKRKGLL